MKKLSSVLILFFLTTAIYAQCWKSVSAGIDHTIAIKPNGTLWAWGFNGAGQLGDGTTKEKNVPVQIGTDSNWITIAAGGNSSFGIKADGTLWAWGDNFGGQLGDGTYGNKRFSPVKIGSDTNWKSISVGRDFTLAIKNDGSLWAWGENLWGQLGNQNSSARSPFRVGTATDWKVISAGGSHTMAIKTDGTLWAWGFNSEGQLGDGTLVNKSTPVKIGNESSWQSIATGDSFSIAVKTNGTLWAWGSNGLGQLGNGTFTDGSIPTQVGTGNNWKSISTGDYSCFATKTDGTLWTWGWIISSVLINTNNTYTTPTQIGSDSDWQSSISGQQHSFAFKADGTLWAWGDYDWGKLGIDLNLDSSKPQLLTSPAPSGSPLQIFCSSATISDLKAIGTNVKWYLAPLGGNPLQVGTALENGKHYYASQTISLCESATRLDVAVSVSSPPPPPTGSSSQSFCGTATISSLNVTGSNVKWYASAIGGLPLVPQAILVSGVNYFASQTINGCESTERKIVTPITNTTPPPTGTSQQFLCAESKLDALVVSGSDIKWYDVLVGGTPLGSSTILKSGVRYYCTQTINSIESCNRLQVIPYLSSSVTLPPIGISSQLFCKGSMLSNLVVNGKNVKWYSEEIGGSPLSLTEILSNNTNYFASQTDNNCESPKRLMIKVLVNEIPTIAPSGALNQNLCNGSVVSDIQVNGNNVKWYSSSLGGAPLENSTVISNGTRYYASQTVNACESLDRLEVIVNLFENNTLTPMNLNPVSWNSLTTSQNFSAAIKKDGSLWAWGLNSDNQLLNGTKANSKKPIRIGNQLDWAFVTSGSSHVMAIKTDGTLWAWGSNGNGQLGIPEVSSIALPSIPMQVGKSNNWLCIEAGGSYSIGLKGDGTLWAWGYNYSGVFGDGTIGPYLIRKQVGQIGSESNWRTFSTDFGYGHVLAIKIDGTLWAWGSNFDGMLGDGTELARLIPTKIGTDNDWKAVSAGGIFSLGLKNDGTLWGWGNNDLGELGDNTRISRNKPSQIGKSNDWKTISAGDRHAAAIKNDGTLWVWGSNYGYQIGDGTNIDVRYLRQVGTDTDWETVSAGYYQTLAIKKNGELWAWGYNGYGEIGDGTDKVVSTPKKIESSSQIVCADATIAELKVGGTDIKWYAQPTGGSPIPTSSLLSNGTQYYASQTVNYCESSDRLNLTIIVNALPSDLPTASSVQSFCSGAKVSNLQVQGNDVKWYSTPEGGTPLRGDTPLISNGKYFASQTTINFCESTSRTSVTVNSVSAPIGNSVQLSCGGATIETLSAEGLKIKWYSSPVGGSPLSSALLICDNCKYYASQTLNDCESLTRLEVTVKSFLNSPSGNIEQSLCSNSPLSSIAIEGSDIKWYKSITGGSSLPITTIVNNGDVYYATQTINTCESLARLKISIVITEVEPPLGNTIQTFCEGAKISDLQVVGSNVNWYTKPSGGETISINTPLINGAQYYASQKINGCESVTRFETTVVINTTPTPTSVSTQSFCSGATIANLLTSEPNFIWYSSPNGGLTLEPSKLLENETYYYASQIQNSCESINRFEVFVTITVTPPPIGLSNQIFCQGETIADLNADGLEIKWYTSDTDLIVLPSTDELATATSYYASQTLNGCESGLRLKVTATVNPIPLAPTGNSLQSFEKGKTVADLVAQGSNLKWYLSETDVINRNNQLLLSVPITEGASYFGTQTISNCESTDWLKVTATIITGFDLNDPLLEFYPNPVNDELNISLNEEIKEIVVLNTLGQIVASKVVNNIKGMINLSDVANGIYLIKVNSSNNSKQFKIIKVNK